jgi:two-component system cell cycle response regulator
MNTRRESIMSFGKVKKGDHMHGKILIVDPIVTNRIVLKVKLSAAYYNVSQASSIAEAKIALEQSQPDVVISSAQLMDGTVGDLAIELRKSPKANDLPIIAVECCDDQNARLAFLNAGVDAVLSKPLNDALLLARVRSLVRSQAFDSEWRLHDDTSRALGFAEKQTPFSPNSTTVLVANNKDLISSWLPQLDSLLASQTMVAAVDEASDYLDSPTNDAIPDVFVLVMDRTEVKKILQLLATLKSHNSTRHSKILILQTAPNQSLGAQALDMGANDLMPHGYHPNEMALRIGTLLKRKHIGDQMRATVRNGLEAAISDPLTGLHNRRYAMPHLDRIARHAQNPYAVMIADMDHFKRINDQYGHAAGDAVLIEMARRLRENLRAVDLIARIGGEEFLIVLPRTSLICARNSARRLCHLIGGTPFAILKEQKPITATISIGLAIGGTNHCDTKTAHQLLDEADKALYDAKMRGRNCVTLSRPAA